MNDRIPAERISAYFDAEVTESERADVERQIATSGDARRELDEVRALSNLLRELPAPKLPEEFCSSVMQAAERATLLPSQDSSANRSGARRLRWISSIVAAAAALVMFAFLINAPQHPAELATAQRGSDSTARPESTATDALSDATFARDALPEVADASVPSSGVAADWLGRKIVFDIGQLSEVQVGDVVEGFDTSGDQIAVVRLFVVDCHKGLESFQLLLTRNQIPVESEARAELAAAAPTDHPADEMVAVFVESSKPQLAAALQQLDRSQGFQGLQLDSPIQIASLEPAMGSQIGMRRTSELKEILTAPKPAAPKQPLAEETVVDQRSKSGTEIEAKTLKKLDTEKSVEPVDELRVAMPSRQLSVRLSDRFFEQRGLQSQIAANRGPSTQFDAKQNQPRFVKPPGEAAGNIAHSVQVLFVLVSEGDGQTKAKSESDKTQPAPKPQEEGAA